MAEVSLIQQVYSSATVKVDNVAGLVCALNQWYWDYPEQNYLHPCVIDGKPALVCAANLSTIDPQAHQALLAISLSFNIVIKQDSRQQTVNYANHERRSNKLITLSFCLGLIAASRLVTADELNKHSVLTAYTPNTSQTMQANLLINNDGSKTISLRHKPLPDIKTVLSAYAKVNDTSKLDPKAEANIKSFFSKNYQAQANDPNYINNDLDNIAHYYAEHPEVVNLLDELKDQKLILQYKADNWQTQALGNQFSVNSVIIYFDTRIGASKLLDDGNCAINPACAITPADALLHELLHAKLMLIDSKHFIELGGMQQNLYPFEHEREVIEHENQLYQQMNSEDSLPRPIRNRHIGNLVHVGCAVCLPRELISSN